MGTSGLNLKNRQREKDSPDPGEVQNAVENEGHTEVRR